MSSLLAPHSVRAIDDRLAAGLGAASLNYHGALEDAVLQTTRARAA